MTHRDKYWNVLAFQFLEATINAVLTRFISSLLRVAKHVEDVFQTNVFMVNIFPQCFVPPRALPTWTTSIFWRCCRVKKSKAPTQAFNIRDELTSTLSRWIRIRDETISLSLQCWLYLRKCVKEKWIMMANAHISVFHAAPYCVSWRPQVIYK